MNHQHSTTHERTLGTHQRNEGANQNVANRPCSSPAHDKSSDDADNESQAHTESAGVTEGHTVGKKEKHGHHAEGGSSTGLPEKGDKHNPAG